jgi:UDPglucose 6-dehydrogenase
MNISIVGTGYVGLTTGALLASAGHKVFCIDVDEDKINQIKQGRSYFYEPGLDDFVKKGIDSGNLIPTLSYEESIPKSEVALISVGTPSNEDGSVNLKFIFSACESIAKNMKSGLVIVQKSTVPVGTGRKLEEILSISKKKFNVVSCPEFLAEGSAVFDTLNMDRFVIGGDSPEAKEKVIKLFESLDSLSKKVDLDKLSGFTETYRGKVKIFNKKSFRKRVLSMGLESSELVKVTANGFLATKISFANSIARICDLSGADINEVMDGIGQDDRIGRAFLYAGLGWGGGCFPKDTLGLSRYSKDLGFGFDMLDEAIEINFDQLRYVASQIEKILGKKFIKSKISILGLSFKPGTSDCRMSPAISLIKELIERGAEKISVIDPEATEEAKREMEYLGVDISQIDFEKDLKEVVSDSEIVILATDWPEFVNIDFKKIRKNMKSLNLYDTRNKWDKENLIELGYNYWGIGR